ncbi:MAG: ATP-binding protein [Nannocystaceae bacterium]
MISAEGALLDWNEEFAAEFVAAARPLEIGMGYGELLMATLPEGRAATLIAGFGDVRSYTYAEGPYRVEVRESMSAGGGFLRVARVIPRAEAERSVEDTLRDAGLRVPAPGRASPRAAGPTGLHEDFVETVTHELRTPMQGILGMVSLLAKTPVNEIQKHYLQALAQSGRTLMALIGDTLEMSKLEKGSLTLAVHDFDLVALVEGVEALLGPRASDRGLRYKITIDPRVPRVLRGDSLRLRQILLNLVSNAIRFTSRGCVSIRVREARDQGRLAPEGSTWIRFEIRDTGVGIASERVATLFDFHRGAAGTPGSGLGLPISRGLVELMGGELSVASEVGAGSTFWFEIPLQAALELNAWSSAGASPAPVSVAGLRVLVVEDEPINQMVLRAFLEEAGCRCDVVGDGGSAVEAALREPYDAILMDLSMPVMDGFAAARAIRESAAIERQPRIIAVTASTYRGVIERVRNAGMDHYVTKPFRSEELLRALAPRGAGEPSDRA